MNWEPLYARILKHFVTVQLPMDHHWCSHEIKYMFGSMMTRTRDPLMIVDALISMQSGRKAPLLIVTSWFRFSAEDVINLEDMLCWVLSGIYGCFAAVWHLWHRAVLQGVIIQLTQACSQWKEPQRDPKHSSGLWLCHATHFIRPKKEMASDGIVVFWEINFETKHGYSEE